MEAREGGGPRGASPHRARGAGEGIADALSREMRRALRMILEAKSGVRFTLTGTLLAHTGFVMSKKLRKFWWVTL